MIPYGTTDPTMSFASVVPLHACYCNNPLASSVVWVGVGRALLPVIWCVYLLETFPPTGHFICGLSGAPP